MMAVGVFSIKRISIAISSLPEHNQGIFLRGLNRKVGRSTRAGLCNPAERKDGSFTNRICRRRSSLHGESNLHRRMSGPSYLRLLLGTGSCKKFFRNCLSEYSGRAIHRVFACFAQHCVLFYFKVLSSYLHKAPSVVGSFLCYSETLNCINIFSSLVIPYCSFVKTGVLILKV